MLLRNVFRYVGIIVLLILFVLNIKKLFHVRKATSSPMTKQDNPTLVEYIPDILSDVMCYKSDHDDVLPRIEKMTVPENSIFFIETSCRPGLDSRQACAIESAARAHRNRQIIVLFAGPQRERLIDKGYIGILKNKLTNLATARLHVDTFAKGTPIEKFMREGKMNESFYKVIHTADVMRLIVLYKYGGLYLDLDVVTSKSYDTLSKNFIGRQDKYLDGEVNSAVFACEKKGVGKRFLDITLADLSRKYDPTKWSDNGPVLMKQTLLKTCNVSYIYEIEPGSCNGFNLYNHTYFYPIKWQHWTQYFIKDHSDWLKNFTSYSFHFWNHLSSETKIHKTSLYAAIAKKYCPTIYDLLQEDFGN